MSADMDNLREKIARALEGEGLSAHPDQYDSSIHGWRCEYPDRYGPCSCFQDCVDAVQTLVREKQAEAWEQGNRVGWSDCTLDTVAAPITITTNPYRTERP